MDDNLIPVLGIICLFGLPVVGWILGRMMKHRERMEMLRMGMMPPPDGRGWRNRDRFAAGVADTVEVVQAQEQVASANDSYIASLYSYNYAKISLARAMGLAEVGVKEYFKGK